MPLGPCSAAGEPARLGRVVPRAFGRVRASLSNRLPRRQTCGRACVRPVGRAGAGRRARAVERSFHARRASGTPLRHPPAFRHVSVARIDVMNMPEIGRGRALAYLAVVVGVLALGGHLLLGRASAREQVPDPVAPTASSTQPHIARTARLVVHVVGAVRRPGLYRLPVGSRVDDAIRKAGGPTRKAVLELLNLAAPLADGEQVVVPRRGAQAGEAALPSPSQVGAPSGPVHLNTATLEQLDALPGIGPVTAQKILDYRAQHGAFRSVDELDAIPGIGPARLEQLRDLVAP